jgi:hypothetical protein
MRANVYAIELPNSPTQLWSTPQPIKLPEYYPYGDRNAKGTDIRLNQQGVMEYRNFCRDIDKQPHCHILKPLLKNTKI